MLLTLHSGDEPMEGYHCIWRSENNVWYIGTWSVMFGVRAIAWRKDSTGRCIDYCAGDDPVFLGQLLVTLKTIFSFLPEDVSEDEVLRIMPGWERRPINRDACWETLQEMAAHPLNTEVDVL